MASLKLYRTLRPSLLSLPPHLRTQTAQHRPFSSSPPRNSTLVDLVTAGPSFLLDSVHSLGIPWHTTIPLTAVLVRTTFVYYTSTLPARKAAQTNSTLLPLINAETLLQMNSDKTRAKIQTLAENHVKQRMIDSHLAQTRLWYWWRAVWRIGGKFGGGMGKRVGGSLGNFGVLLGFAEAIRVKCGTREGLLSLVLRPFEYVGGKIAPDIFVREAEKQAVNPAEVLASRIQASVDAREAQIAEAQGDELMNLSDYSPASPQSTQLSDIRTETLPGPEHTTSVNFDPTLQTEGLSWCLDLTLPDPTGLLPLAVLASMTATTLLRPTTLNKAATPISSTQNPTPSTLPPWLSHLTLSQKIGLGVATVFAFVAQHMPAAILLYFIPSILVGWLQNRWLDVKYPMRAPIRPCRRPVRVKKKMEWS